ncbi:hypothetical protein HN51_031517, partial [Arachis hypogaea]
KRASDEVHSLSERVQRLQASLVPEETAELLEKSDLYFFSPEHPPLTEPAQKALDWAG